ncbi:MAG: abortive infection family protein [Candidatus Aminicenantales bacterium]
MAKISPQQKISEITRCDIRDLIILEHIKWSGRLEEADFLARLYDIDNMPSHDSRFTTARSDIRQHRSLNFDWDDDWIFNDSRFKLMTADDDMFLSFLCETIHPAVRPDQTEAQKFLSRYNEILVDDGFKIIEKERKSGKPIYMGVYVGVIPGPDWEMVKQGFKSADDTYVAAQLKRIQDSIEKDPELAIGTAKELVETVCKTILVERGQTFPKGAEIPDLVRLASKILRLTPRDIPDGAKASKTIKRLLSNLGSIPQGIAELRNLYGTGHGRPAGTKGLLPRHARLAAGTASTLARFLLDSHRVK